jgi:hypothetical protein
MANLYLTLLKKYHGKPLIFKMAENRNVKSIIHQKA